MLDALFAVLTGGATGLLGAALSFATDFLARRQRHAQEVELRRLDAEMARIEAEGAARAAALEAESERDAARWSAMEASYAEAGRRWSAGGHSALVWVDVARGLLRPVLTLASLAFIAAIYWSLGTWAETVAMQERIVDTALYIATTCVLWWFGARGVSHGAPAAQAGGR